jgi:hypothetical protein
MPREISAVALYVPRVCIGAQPRRCSHANHANCSPTASTDAPNDNGDRHAAPRRAKRGAVTAPRGLTRA